MNTPHATLLSLSIALALAGCGGGSGSPGTTSEPSPIADDRDRTAPEPPDAAAQAAEIGAARNAVATTLAFVDFSQALREAVRLNESTIEAMGSAPRNDTGGDSLGEPGTMRTDESRSAYSVACAQAGSIRVRYWDDDGDGVLDAGDDLSIAPSNCQSSVGGRIVTAARVDWAYAAGAAAFVFAQDVALAAYDHVASTVALDVQDDDGETVTVASDAFTLDLPDEQVSVVGAAGTIPTTGYAGVATTVNAQYFGEPYAAQAEAGYGAVEIATEPGSALAEQADGSLALTAGAITVEGLGDGGGSIRIEPAADPAFLRFRLDADGDDLYEIDRFDVAQQEVIGRH